MQDDRIGRAQEFIWRNARLLERARFAFHFRGAPNEAAVRALLAYRNPDRGFGNALEPDKRDPHSQPVDIQTALEILDELNALDAEIAGEICEFLLTITAPGGGVPYALPSINDYPHTPWWQIDSSRAASSLNPTAAIAGLLLKRGARHRWLDGAAAFCWNAIEASETTEFHDLMPMICFLEHAPEQSRAKRELARIAARIRAPGTVEHDPAATGYTHKPLEWAPTPDSFCAALFDDDLVALHLEALAARQQADGGWPIAWQSVGPGAELEWRGVVTLGALRTLRAYGWQG